MLRGSSAVFTSTDILYAACPEVHSGPRSCSRQIGDHRKCNRSSCPLRDVSLKPRLACCCVDFDYLGFFIRATSYSDDLISTNWSRLGGWSLGVRKYEEQTQ